MIKFFKKNVLKNGEIVEPFLIEGKNVYCIGANGNTIIKHLDDFINEPVIEENVITPEIYHTDKLFDENTQEEIKPIKKDNTEKNNDEQILNNDDYI